MRRAILQYLSWFCLAIANLYSMAQFVCCHNTHPQSQCSSQGHSTVFISAPATHCLLIYCDAFRRRLYTMLCGGYRQVIRLYGSLQCFHVFCQTHGLCLKYIPSLATGNGNAAVQRASSNTHQQLIIATIGSTSINTNTTVTLW